MEKCAIFIDGGYLDALLKKWSNFPLDYNKFVDGICRIVRAQLLRVYYYNCLPLIRRMYDVVCYDCKGTFQVHFDSDEGVKLYCDKCAKIKNMNINFIKYSSQMTKEDEERYKKKEKFL